MYVGRVGRRLARAVLCAIVLLPALAMVVASYLDLGPDLSHRVSVFPAALVLLDPLTWGCLRNSAVVAAVAAIGSFFLGVPIARILARWQFWGRRPLCLLVTTPAAVPPLVAALGLRSWFDPALPSPFVGSGISALRPWTWDIGAAWVCWAWISLILGVTLVVRAVGNALRRVDPDWESAARAAGASSWTTWRTITWPLVRPSGVRAAVLVFGLVLVDPAAPLLLRLRWTLGYQIVEAATTGAPPTRAAVLALLGVLCAAVVTLVARLGLGPTRIEGDGEEPARPQRAAWWRAALYMVLLTTWVALAWTPAILLLSTLSPRTGPWESNHLDLARSLIAQPQVASALLHSGILGVLVGTAAFLIARTVVGENEPVASRRALSRAIALLRLMPPVVLGVGMLCVGSLLVVPGIWLERTMALGEEGGNLPRALAGWTDWLRVPWIALALALTLRHLPLLLGAVQAAHRRRSTSMEESARSLGASRWRAWWDVSGRATLVPILGAWLLAATLAATDLGAAVLLASTPAFQPIGPAILDLADSPGNLPAAQLLAVLALGLSVASSLLAWRSFQEPRGNP